MGKTFRARHADSLTLIADKLEEHAIRKQKDKDPKEPLERIEVSHTYCKAIQSIPARSGRVKGNAGDFLARRCNECLAIKLARNKRDQKNGAASRKDKIKSSVESDW